MRKFILSVSFLSVLMLSLGSAFNPQTRLIWNRTESAPKGLYWLSDDPFTFGRWAFVVSLVVVVTAIIILNQPRLIAWMLEIIAGLPVVGKLHDKLEEAYESMRQLVGWKALTVTTLMSVISWSMEGIAFYWIITALGGGGSVLDALFIFSMTTILGAVSFLPGGLGVTEGGMIGGLMLLGVFTTRAPAGAATYLIRFATLWFGVLVGFFALLRFRRVYGEVPEE